MSSQVCTSDKIENELAGCKILLVDDTPQNLRILRKALEPEGYVLLVATNGEDAVRIAGSANPDLVLMDVQMPGINGFEACRLLKENPDTESIPVIFVTAMDQTSFVVEGLKAGGVDYIIKPFQNKEVLARVATHLRIDFLQKQLERSNDQIRENARKKSEFMQHLVHEFRQPLNVIVGFTNIVRRKSPLEEVHAENLDTVVGSAIGLNSLVDDILDLSKAEVGQLEAERSDVDVAGVFRYCGESARVLLNPGVEIVYELDEDIGWAQTDEKRLRQILMNLLSNAAKFTETGRVTARMHRARGADPTGLIVEVSDTGCGIPDEKIHDVFEPFFQVEETKIAVKGTGLGLSMTKMLAELLGGSVEVESSFGEGTTFRVHLPSTMAATGPEPGRG